MIETDKTALVDRAFACVALRYQVPIGALRAPRSRRASRLRQIVFWLLWDRGLSYSEIGRLVGADRTTVTHGVARVAGDESLLLQALREALDTGAGPPVARALPARTREVSARLVVLTRSDGRAEAALALDESLRASARERARLALGSGSGTILERWYEVDVLLPEDP